MIEFQHSVYAPYLISMQIIQVKIDEKISIHTISPGRLFGKVEKCMW